MIRKIKVSVNLIKYYFCIIPSIAFYTTTHSTTVMTLCKRTKNEKLKYNIKRKAVKISALSSREKDKYEYLTEEHVLHSDEDTIN